jgi:hypothetical protein
VKKLLFTIAILALLPPVGAWGATVWVKDIGGTVYYESGASSCDDVTAADTSGDLEAAACAAGNAGICYVCAGTYSDTELDADSQLRLDEANLTFQAVGTVTISTTVSTVPVLLRAAGITFKGFSVICPDAAGTNYAIFADDDSDGYTIIDNTITCAGDATGSAWRGINAKADGTISTNDISGVRTGIQIEPDTGSGFVVLIQKNTIHDLDAGTDFASDGIIFANSGTPVSYSGTIVELNDISGWKDDGIDLLDGADIIVRNNYVHDPSSVCTAGCDGQGIKCGSSHAASVGNIIDSNRVINSDNHGIVSNDSDGVIVRNNIVVVTEASATGIQFTASSEGGTAYNNTSICTGASAKGLSVGAGASGTYTIKNNILDKGASGTNDFDANIVTITGGYNCLVRDAAPAGSDNYTNTDSADKAQTNPLFRNAANAATYGLKLRGGSPCINAGTSGGSIPTTDIEGKDWIGNNEMGCHRWAYVESILSEDD